MRLLLVFVLLLGNALAQQVVFLIGSTWQGTAASGATFKAESHASTSSTGANAFYDTPGTLSIASNDYLLVLIGYQTGPTVNSVVCGSNTLTVVKTQAASSYSVAVYALVNATSAGSTSCRVNFSVSSVNFPAIVGANWSGVPASVTTQSSCNSAGCNTLAATSTARTAQNLTPAAGTALLIGVGIDWDANSSHTSVNGYTTRVAVAADGTSPFLADRDVSPNGSTAYPSGSFTTAANQQYLSFFLTIQW